MNKKRTYKFHKHTLAIAVACLMGQAQAVGLRDLYIEAKASDPQFAAAKAEREATDALFTQAVGQLLPQVSANYSRGKNETVSEYRPSNPPSTKAYDFVQKSGTLNLSQALFRPQAWLAMTQSRAQIRQAEGQFRQAQSDLILRLSQAYFEVLLSEDNVSLAAEQKAAIGEQLKQAKRYFEAGVGTITDINEAQARYDTIVAQELAAQNALEIKVRGLEQLVGKTYRQLDRLGSRLVLESPLPSAVEQWIEFSMNNNPILKAREAAYDIAQQEVYKGASGHLPTVDLVASRGKSDNPGYTLIDYSNWNTSVGVQVNIPIFSGGTTQGRVNQSLSLREKAGHELEATKRAVVQSARQEFLNVLSGVAQVKALEQAVKSNELALHSARKGQEAGLRTSFDVLNTQQLLFSAKRDLAQAKYSYVLSRLKLRAASGLLGEEDVELVQNWLEVGSK